MSPMINKSVSSFSHYQSDNISLGDEVDDDELIQMVNDLKQELKFIVLENEILERTMMRLEPTLMNGIQQAIEYVNKLQTTGPTNFGGSSKSQPSRIGFESGSMAKILSSPSRMFASPSRACTRRVESSVRLGGHILSGAGPKINVLEKTELVNTEMEIVSKALSKTRVKSAVKHALLKAQLEEIDVKVVDIDNASAMFKQNVLVDGWDPIAKRVSAEAWLAFIAEWMKVTDKQVGKLRLRISTTNSLYHKLKSQIKVKADLSENLREVDFEKIAIENTEAEHIIERKLQQLVELKEMTGEANLNVAIHKKSLAEQNNYLQSIIDLTKQKLIDTVHLEKQAKKIKIEADELEREFKESKANRLMYEVPDIMDYVQTKSDLADLHRCIKVLENRARILQIELSSMNRKRNSLEH